MITIEYKGTLIEIPINMWGAFEEEQDTALEFLGDDDSPDIVLNDEQYQKMAELAKTSKIASHIISELSQTGEQYENAPMRKWESDDIVASPKLKKIK